MKKLSKTKKSPSSSLSELERALTEGGAVPTPCVTTIPRSVDGRIQILDKKGFPMSYIAECGVGLLLIAIMS